MKTGVEGLLSRLKAARGRWDNLRLLCLCEEAAEEIEWQRQQVETLQRLVDLQETYIAKLESDFENISGEKE